MRNTRTVLLAVVVILLSATPCGIARAQSNSKEIMALPPAELIAILQKADAGVFEKAKAFQRLATIGAKDAVPALVPLLSDEKLNVYARNALEAIPDPAVDEALRAATKQLLGRQLVGVIDSIGQRRDKQAVGLLQSLMGDQDAAVASAAAGALGRIGTEDAAAALKEWLGKESAVKSQVADASLACAEGLAAAGQKASALSLYEVVGQGDLPRHLQLAALAGRFHVLQGEAKELLLSQLKAEDAGVLKVALAAARYLPGAEITAALTEALDQLPPQRQALVLLALGDRTERVALARVMTAARSESPEVRVAAVAVLSKLGDAAALPILLEAALDSGPAAPTAIEGLKNLKGDSVDEAVVAKLGEVSGSAKIVFLDIAAARRIKAATVLARQCATASDEPLRLAALAALGQLVELGDLDLLLSRAFAAADTPERKAAQQALETAALRMADREATSAKFASVLGKQAVENKVFLLDLLGKLAGPTALETVAAHTRSDDDALKDAATRVLGDWPNPEAADTVLAVARTEKTNKYQIRALRGYIRIARQLQFPDDKRLAMFQAAMEVAKRTDEKRLALDILTRIPSVETLQLTVSYLGVPELKEAAGEAAVAIAEKVITANAPAVAEAMGKVLAADAGGRRTARAQQLLDRAKANPT
jgi:HEAT repeat protein